MTEEQLREFLRNNLELDVDTRQELSASIDGDLFDEVTTVKLILAGEVISEVDIN